MLQKSKGSCKAHNHSGLDVPEILEKLTAMQDRLVQSWLKSSQPCRIGCPEMFEKFTAMSQPFKIGCPRHASKVQGCSRVG